MWGAAVGLRVEDNESEAGAFAFVCEKQVQTAPTRQAACDFSPRGMPSLHEGSGHGQPEQRRREGRPAPAAPMAVLFRRGGLHLSAAYL